MQREASWESRLRWRSQCSGWARRALLRRRAATPGPTRRAAPWETGANWSTNAPPTSGQHACITIALSAPVSLGSSPTIAGLTLGGSSGSAELTGNGTLTLGGDSSIADTGVLAVGSGRITIHQTGTLTNDGKILPASSGFELVGNLMNAADGLILDNSAGFYLDGPGTFTNDGELSFTGSGALTSPFNGGPAATVVNAGAIENTSSSHSSIGAGATLEETSGVTTGTPVQINGGTLDLEGSGNSSYQLVGTSTLTGTVAASPDHRPRRQHLDYRIARPTTAR